MKVVHVVRQYLPSIGGMEEVVRNLVHFQHTAGHYEPRVLTLDRIFREPGIRLPQQETLDGIAVRRLPYRGSERYPLCPQVLKDLADADLVHVHGIDFFFDFLALTRHVHGKRLIASTHGGFFHSQFAQRLKRIYFNSVTRLSARAYRRIISTSENDGEIFSRIVAERRLRVVENGVDILKFENASSLQLQPTLIYFGRWSVNKGLLETLDVFAALCTEMARTPWRLIIAGREYDLDAAALRKRAEQLGVGGRVEIVPGPSNEVLRSLIAQASYFICQSHHEGFGIAPIEAMSAGLFPILSAIPPFRRLVEASRVGLLLEAAEPRLQAQQIAVLHVLHLPLQAVDRRETARRAAAAYSWQGVANSYAEQYDQVLER
jgi:alpha-1,3-mannosyltransferase